MTSFFPFRSGAFSKVYAGFDKTTNKEVAIKVMTKANIREKQVRTILQVILGETIGFNNWD